MHTLKILSFFIALTLISSSVIESKECREQLKFSFDDREWKEDFQSNDQIGSITEYTLKNETVTDWSELVTVQKLIPIKVSAYDYYLDFVKGLKKEVNPLEVRSQVLKQSEDDILFEWSISGRDGLSQHEWFRLIKTPQSTWVLRYTTKKLQDVEKQRPIWEKILNSATLVREGDCQ
ncbi:hypothetical protein [Parachlamydia sp.]|uniref:hypothetical protein n=1 Tax=Parachlamydia sp. TaxID=2052048 RepID=UPI003D0A34B1